MQPIDLSGDVATPHLASLDRQELALVNGGFGALLGALLQAAPGILQGVSGIISASKGGGGSGSAPAPAAAPAAAPPQPDPATAQASAAPSSSPAPSASPVGFPQVLVIRFG